MKKIISMITICAIAMSFAGCAQNGTSEPAASTTNPIYVQEDEYQTTSTTTSATSASTTEPVESKPEVPAVKGNKFNVEGVYNTTAENNISDEVYYEIYIEYTKEDGTVVSETISLDDNITYNDLAMKLDSFGLITTGVTRERSVTVDTYAKSDCEFEYSGIGHNISLAPDTETALYLELVDDKGIVTDTTLLGSDKYDPSVKAISSRLFTKSESTDDDMNLIQRIPVKVIFKMYFPDNIIETLPNKFIKEEAKDGCYEMKVGMSFDEAKVVFDDTLLLGYELIIKNTDYTLVICADDTYIRYVGDIILIKN